MNTCSYQKFKIIFDLTEDVGFVDDGQKPEK